MKGGLPAASACTSLTIGAHSASHVAGLTNERIVAPHLMTKAMTDGSWCANVPASSPFWGAEFTLAFRVPQWDYAPLIHDDSWLPNAPRAGCHFYFLPHFPSFFSQTNDCT